MDQDTRWEKASLYHAMKAIGIHLEAGDHDAARRCLADLTANFQTEWEARSTAATCYELLGEHDRARIEAGIALALAPNNYAASKRMARYLVQDGQRDAARRVLEHGWEQKKKNYPKKQWADERALYFAFSEDELPPHLAERWRRERPSKADMAYIKDNLP